MGLEKNERAKSRDQKRRYGRGHATGCHRVRNSSNGEVQHREGHRRFHQEGIRQKVQSHLARNRRPKLRELRDPRDEALHLLLPRTSRNPPLQIRLTRREYPKDPRNRANPKDPRKVQSDISNYFQTDCDIIVYTLLHLAFMLTLIYKMFVAIFVAYDYFCFCCI